VDAAYAGFLAGNDDEYQHLLADLEKKIGNLSNPHLLGSAVLILHIIPSVINIIY